MVECARIHDPGLVVQAMTHPRVWPSSSDDFSMAPEKIGEFIDTDAQVYLGCWATQNDEYLGCFLLHQHNHILFEVHTMLLPQAWGRRALDCGAQALKWVWQNLPARRLITSVPANNPLALRFALKIGFVEWGYNPRSIQKGGKLIDQHMLGIDRAEF